ncbi:MAG: membrane protein insertion efficiency factor YidD [Nocardioidaceae bacterium]
MKYLLIGLLKVYRAVVSPLYGQVCRYYPSCSAYALESVQRYGSIRGSWLAVRRVSRCHPWARGGVDPVPDVFSWRAAHLAGSPATELKTNPPAGLRTGSEEL